MLEIQPIINPNVKALAEAYKINDPIRLLEAIEIEQIGPSENISVGEVSDEVRVVATELGVRPEIVIMALETETYYNDR